MARNSNLGVGAAAVSGLNSGMASLMEVLKYLRGEKQKQYDLDTARAGQQAQTDYQNKTLEQRKAETDAAAQMHVADTELAELSQTRDAYNRRMEGAADRTSREGIAKADRGVSYAQIASREREDAANRANKLDLARIRGAQEAASDEEAFPNHDAAEKFFLTKFSSPLSRQLNPETQNYYTPDEIVAMAQGYAKSKFPEGRTPGGTPAPAPPGQPDPAPTSGKDRQYYITLALSQGKRQAEAEAYANDRIGATEGAQDAAPAAPRSDSQVLRDLGSQYSPPPPKPAVAPEIALRIMGIRPDTAAPLVSPLDEIRESSPAPAPAAPASPVQKILRPIQRGRPAPPVTTAPAPPQTAPPAPAKLPTLTEAEKWKKRYDQAVWLGHTAAQARDRADHPERYNR